MNVGFFNKFPVMPLILLWLAYAFLGWYLAAHHIIWLAGVFLCIVAITVVRKSISWLGNLFTFGSKALVIILLSTGSLALLITWPLFFGLFLIPILASLLADLEMRFAGFNKLDSFWTLTVFAVLGLVMGEMLDILILPSSRF